MQHQLAGHRAHHFGASSETSEQLQLALETTEIAIGAMTAKRHLPQDVQADKPKHKPIPDHIPRVEVELSPGSAECAQCGGKLRRLGEDVTEALEYVPGRFILNRIVRPRITCSGCDCFTQAPLPSIARQAIAKQSAERGDRSSAGGLVRAFSPMSPLSAVQASPAGQRVSKYADHLPLYRQSQIFNREGLDLDRSTLADWVGKSTALLEPLAEATHCPAVHIYMHERGTASIGGASHLCG